MGDVLLTLEAPTVSVNEHRLRALKLLVRRLFDNM